VNRPTPVARVLPILLRHFEMAGIANSEVRILMAGGSHGAPSMKSVRSKIGAAYSLCEVLVHDPEKELGWIGRTSFGTPVWANRLAAASDLLIGIGGLYPSQSLGFGGGSKLAMGVLGLRTIEHLHYRHRSIGCGRIAPQNSFRGDLDEIARLLKLETTITVHANACQEAVRVVCGNPLLYFAEEAAFARKWFGAALPGNADVVIANAYPTDLTLTFANMKGFYPLRQCQPGASRIAIAPCSEGIGMHRVFPFGKQGLVPRFTTMYRKLTVKGPREILRKARERAIAVQKPHAAKQNPIWIYRPGNHEAFPEGSTAGMRITSSWSDILAAVRNEQGVKRRLNTVVYPCAPIQFLNPALNLKEDECESIRNPTLLNI
jgi:lactate racemase